MFSGDPPKKRVCEKAFSGDPPKNAFVKRRFQEILLKTCCLRIVFKMFCKMFCNMFSKCLRNVCQMFCNTACLYASCVVKFIVNVSGLVCVDRVSWLCVAAFQVKNRKRLCWKVDLS